MHRTLPLLLALIVAGCAGSLPGRTSDTGRTPDGRKGRVVVTPGGPIVIGGVSVPARVYDPDGDGRFTVCHKGKKSLEIARPAVDAHVRHGDYLGACGRPIRYAGYEAQYERATSRDKGKRGRGHEDRDDDRGKGKGKGKGNGRG